MPAGDRGLKIGDSTLHCRAPGITKGQPFFFFHTQSPLSHHLVTNLSGVTRTQWAALSCGRSLMWKCLEHHSTAAPPRTPSKSAKQAAGLKGQVGKNGAGKEGKKRYGKKIDQEN